MITKAYYYLCFRIYMFYKDTMNENDFPALFTSLAVTVILAVNLMSIYYVFVTLGIVDEIPNKYYTLTFGFLVWLANYFLFIKQLKFLDYNFEKDEKGGYVIIGFLLITILFFIIVANCHRSQILI